MRLIYRGKVVANDADSLETVFGADNVRSRAPTVLCMCAWKLTRAPAPRVQRPKPAPGPARTAASALDIAVARAPHSSHPAQSIPSRASTAPRQPSADEPVPGHTTPSTKLAATSRSTAAPSPPCAAAAQPTRSHRRYPAPAPDATADCASVGPARRSSAHTSCGCTNTDTASRRSRAWTHVDGGSSRPSTGRTSTWIWRAPSTKWQDGTARGNWTKSRALVRHLQRLHSKHTATAWTADHAATCSIRCCTPSIWFAGTRWSERTSELASTAASRNSTGGCS